ncbi:SPFH domain-containing protein [Clostridium aminobutyricum]|uniref:SPFH domain-containing protein n=1 Tax=Clostridium aminobutyricum TaxID=33953 RepID=A0A939DAU1_CLOAM|nr:SPFH domain-containing protein [Clostridium aminobutyricum]MBN7774336.1 SPFH domain-containing protein [Clostridium aminobutyricum]
MAIIDVVKYNGTPDVFAWKYPSEELGTWSQLVVNESQEAILFKDGMALDVFGSGRYTLDTPNIPILNNIVNLPFGGRSPFAAEVWYVNKAFSLDIKWGTATPIQIQDAKYGIFIPIRANGVFGLQIKDSKQFLLKLVGTLSSFNKADMVKFFRGLYITKVKDAVSQYIVNKQISMLEINAYIDELSNFMKERIEPTMSEYGIKLVNFYINDLSVPEDDSAVIKLKEALAKKAEMNILGYNYQQERSFDTLEGAAKNPGAAVSPLMGAGIGLGIGAGLGEAVSNSFGTIAGVINTNAVKAKECPNCHTVMAAAQRFCGACGCDTEKIEGNQKEVTFCNECGCELNPKIKFCPNCGNKYNPCPSCGADLEEGATSCSKCGYDVGAQCPKCGAILPSKVKFCPECGESLTKKCPKCDSIIEGNPKFCLECGEKLVADAENAQ